MPPGIRRLAAISTLDDSAIATLMSAATGAIAVPPRKELASEGRPVPGPILVLDGWAARQRIMQDGRRQFISFVLPGDIIGLCGFDRAVASSTAVAVTATTICPLPTAAESPMLDRAYAVSRALDEAHLMGQIVRLGRLNARERIIDLMLELQERLSPAGIADEAGLSCPLTQEMLADVLGLTAVHVNRTIQATRRRGELIWNVHLVRLADIALLRNTVGRVPPRVA